MKKVMLIAVVALMGLSVKAQSSNEKANLNGKNECTYYCERNEMGEIIKLVEYIQTPNGKLVARPIIIKGGGGPILEKPRSSGGLTINCNYVASDAACYGPNAIDCVCVGTMPSGPEDL